ncbi:16S rRNA (cytosine(967)-C(5))-methyltransferase RsmB [Hydrogenophaga sp. OTU3427]|uniref:16S rRNA (cytosine(967)-C(5))-methyltransferase RsmB n=1 Tax=Hydrogenophaga sp. OTU3427 TaxID=3043856 RepID=UPI00313B016F
MNVHAPLPSGPSLAQQIQHAAQCLRGVQAGRSLTELLPAVPAALRPGVQAIAFHALRQAGLSAALVRLLAARAPTPAVRTLMQVALSLMPAVCVADGDPRYDAHTLVNQTVQAAKAERDTQAQAGFVNACLRRFLREAEALLAEARRDPVALWNHPAWWIRRVQQDHPQDWQAILRANNRPGGMALRVNRRQGTREAYQQQLQALGMGAHPVGEDGLVLDQPVPVDRLPGFAQGSVSVQDPAAQQAAPLLLAGQAWPAGARVLDACAAPGGKAAHLLERAELDLWALDADAQRCARIHDNLRRLGLTARVRHADAGRPADWWDGQPFDAILLDAPCTASGIVRRHPDVRWLRRESDIAQLAAVQRELLEALWPLLRPGGRLLYATCSVFRAEGDAQVQAFLERHTDARRGAAPGHLLPGRAGSDKQFNDNAPGEHDGFFYARLDKSAA